MLFFLLLLLLCLPAPSFSSSSSSSSFPTSTLSLPKKAAQLLQISIQNVIHTTDSSSGPVLSVDEDKLLSYMSMGIGSFLDSPTSSSDLPVSAFPPSEYSKLSPSSLLTLLQLSSSSFSSSSSSSSPPPLLLLPIFAIDSIHGASYLQSSTLLPQPINQAATFDPSSAFAAGATAASETLALTSGAYRWVFSPLLGVASNPLWSRVWETYGSSPTLVAAFARAATSGIQSLSVIPSAKHYRGYSRTPTGADRSYPSSSHPDDAKVWSSVLAGPAPPQTIMTSYTSVNGRVPTTADVRTLTLELRGRNKYGKRARCYTAEAWRESDPSRTAPFLSPIRGCS